MDHYNTDFVDDSVLGHSVWHPGGSDIRSFRARHPWGDSKRPKGPLGRDPNMPYYRFLKELRDGETRATKRS